MGDTMFLPRLLLLLSSCCLFAAVTPKRLELSDIFQLENASEPQISLDGKRIVYTRHSADIMKDTRPSNLWIVNFDGTGHRPLTSGSFAESTPRWSPDGSQIAFLSNRDGSFQIYRLFLDSGQVAKLTNVMESPAGIDWSPDGNLACCLRHVHGEGQPLPIGRPVDARRWLCHIRQLHNLPAIEEKPVNLRRSVAIREERNLRSIQ